MKQGMTVVRSWLALAGLVVALALPGTAGAAGTTPGPEKRFFPTEAEALRGCGADPVVWVNKNTKVYHARESRWYGKTKEGAFGCRREMDQAGFRPAKSE